MKIPPLFSGERVLGHSVGKSCDDAVSFDALKNSFACISGHSFVSRYRLILPIIYIYKTECLFVYFVCKSTVLLRS
jgi:hypothetical protein